MPAVLQHKSTITVSRTGRLVTIRPCTPEDAPRVPALYDRLSPRALRLRYCSAVRISGEAEAARLCNSDPADRAVLLALSEGEVIGIGELGRMDEDCAEIALLVRDDCQGEGIGTALGHELVEVARELGYTRLQAYMLAENRAMRRIIAKLPFTRNWEGSWGELCVTVELESPATVG